MVVSEQEFLPNLMHIIRTLSLRKDLLTLNTIVQMQMMLNAHLLQIQQLSWKTFKNVQTCFWPIIN